MKTKEALEIVGGLSKPSKMPGWAYGLPAKECKTGSKLQNVPGSTCYDCYALKGCYVFKVVQDAQYRRLKAIRSPLWTGAMAYLINSKKSNVFRWHDSGDVQDEEHLLNYYKELEKIRKEFEKKMKDQQDQDSSNKPQAPSNKPQAPSVKPQASEDS
jgi:hypothetical protein